MQFYFQDQWPRRIQVAVVMGDCHSRAVTCRPAVAHAGGVKVNAFPLHLYRPMAPLKLSGFMRSSWVPVVPCLLFLWPFTLEPLLRVCMSAGRRPSAS